MHAGVDINKQTGGICGRRVGNSLYTEVKQGDYLSIINAKITKAGANTDTNTPQPDTDNQENEENTNALIDTIELPIEPLTIDDYVVEVNGSETWNTWDELSNGALYSYVFYNPLVDKDEASVMCTRRGIRLGNTYDDVVAAYGEAEKQPFDYSHDMLYEGLSYDNPEHADFLKEQCVSYIKYNVEGAGSIKFLFDSDDTLSWVHFLYFQ